MSTFRLQVMSLKRLLFNGEVASVFLTGDEGEYEILPYHYPLIGALEEGEIRIAGYESIALRAGVVMFDENKCTIVIEEAETRKEGGISWGELQILETEKVQKPQKKAS